MQARICLKVILKSWGLDIWVSSTSWKRSNIGWPQQTPKEKVLRFNMIFYFFQNIKIKLNSRTCMTLKSSVVIFQALETSAASTTSMASMTFTASFYQKKLLLLMVGYSEATKWPILVLFCGMDHQKPKFSLISVPFLSEAVEVSRYYFFENWLMILKYPNLKISEPPSNKF